MPGSLVPPLVISPDARAAARRTPAPLFLIRLLTAGAVLVFAIPAVAAKPSPLPDHLGDTGLYVDRTLTRIAPNVLAYTPQYPLWSDGASKRRWIRLPRGTSIDARDPDAWLFPIGTRVWKEFSRERRRETRLMVRTSSGWLYGTYRWTEDGTDAVLVPAEGAVDRDPGGQYVFPSHQDCLSCHEGRPSPVLGFSALQLSSDRDPEAPHREEPVPDAVDLAVLLDRRLIRHAPPEWRAHPPRIEAATPTERAALGYLHGNCGGCHNTRGSLAGLGLDTWIDPARPGRSTSEVVASLLGPSRFRIPGVPASLTARLAPGAPQHSAILARMGTREPASQMPPVGTRMVDDAAVREVQRWVQELSTPSPR